MSKTIRLSLALALLALSTAASAVNVTLTAHNQRSSSGTLSTLKWKTCAPTGAANPCLSTTNAWTLANATGSTAVWEWDPVSGVLTGTGTFQTTSFVGSNANGSSVISDKVVDMVVDTVNDTTTAASYVCIEGTFLAGVGAHGCANLSLGDNFAYDSSVAYNVGGAANCVQRTIGGDDVSTGNPRGLASAAASGGCDAVDGAFNVWTVEQDNLLTGGTLILSNGLALSAAGVNYLTFTLAPTAVDDGPVNALQGVATPINVLQNDLAFTNPVTVTITGAPTQGSAVVNGSPGAQAGISITYTANVAATGSDTFEYTVLDGNGTTTDSATVTINILEGGANDDTASTTRNRAININVATNDVGFLNPVTIGNISSPSNGGSAAPGAAAGTIDYTPATTPPGTATYVETFTYDLTDANNLVDTATVTVTVNNAVPVAGDTGAPGVTIVTTGVAPASTSGTFNAATFAGNSLGDAPSVVSAGAGASGTTSVSGNVVTYTPGATFFKGTDTFTYTITDGDPGTPDSDTGTVTVTIADVSPALADAAITTTAGKPSTPRALGTTLGNGSLAQHTFAVSTQATGGSCALTGGNTTLTYTPNSGFTGNDSCVVTVTDEAGAGQGDTATFTITVNAGASSSGGVGSGLLPGGGGALDPWSLALLAAIPLIRRRRGQA